MIVELTNHYIEMSAQYEIERIEENRYGSVQYFRFYFGRGRWSREYSEPTYTYIVINDRK
jgi:hypothetical protein